MAYRINLTNESQRITAATIDSSCTPRDRSLTKYTGVTTNNAWDDIVNGSSTPGDTALVLVINANTGSSSREGYGEIMYNIDGTECSNIIHLVQEGTTPSEYHFTLYINNDSDYITDFTDITLTVNSSPVEMITILNDLSGVPAHTVSQGIPYTAHTVGNSVQCVAQVTNNKYSYEIKTLPCNFRVCDPGEDESVTFKYDNNT